MSRRIVVATVGVLLAALLVLGTIDTFLWLPQYLAPGIPLSRIYAALAASSDLPSCILSPVIWLVFWGVLAAGYVAVMLPVHATFAPVTDAARLLGTTAIGVLLIGATGFFHFWSAFAMGMSVSDELPPGAGGTTPLGTVIVTGGMLAGVAGLLLGVVALVTRRRRSPAAA